jgi:hypothetical protein
MNVNMRASAVLVWLDGDVNPTLESFGPGDVCPPPSPNPEAWWCLEDAIKYVGDMQRDHKKVPWIKTDDTILGPTQIGLAYDVLRASTSDDQAKTA